MISSSLLLHLFFLWLVSHEDFFRVLFIYIQQQGMQTQHSVSYPVVYSKNRHRKRKCSQPEYYQRPTKPLTTNVTQNFFFILLKTSRQISYSSSRRTLYVNFLIFFSFTYTFCLENLKAHFVWIWNMAVKVKLRDDDEREIESGECSLDSHDSRDTQDESREIGRNTGKEKEVKGSPFWEHFLFPSSNKNTHVSFIRIKRRRDGNEFQRPSHVSRFVVILMTSSSTKKMMFWESHDITASLFFHLLNSECRFSSSWSLTCLPSLVFPQLSSLTCLPLISFCGWSGESCSALDCLSPACQSRGCSLCLQTCHSVIPVCVRLCHVFSLQRQGYRNAFFHILFLPTKFRNRGEVQDSRDEVNEWRRRGWRKDQIKGWRWKGQDPKKRNASLEEWSNLIP